MELLLIVSGTHGGSSSSSWGLKRHPWAGQGAGEAATEAPGEADDAGGRAGPCRQTGVSSRLRRLMLAASKPEKSVPKRMAGTSGRSSSIQLSEPGDSFACRVSDETKRPEVSTTRGKAPSGRGGLEIVPVADRLRWPPASPPSSNLRLQG